MIAFGGDHLHDEFCPSAILEGRKIHSHLCLACVKKCERYNVLNLLAVQGCKDSVGFPDTGSHGHLPRSARACDSCAQRAEQLQQAGQDHWQFHASMSLYQSVSKHGSWLVSLDGYGPYT